MPRLRSSHWLSFFSLILSVAILGMGAPAHAEQGFGVSPTSQDLTLLPGSVTTGQLTVINDGDTSITYTVYATDYAVTGQIYKGVFVNNGEGPNLSARTWFTLPKGNFVIGPRKQIFINYSISVPKTAAIGGHYAAIFLQTVPPPSTGTYISRVVRVATIFYMGVGGDLSPSGHYVGLSVPWLQTLPPIDGNLKIANTGNVHFLVSGTAQLYSPFGKVGTPVVLDGEVLPSTTREFPFAIGSPSPLGLYRVVVKANYMNDNLMVATWMLLIPRLTLIILSTSIGLVMVAIVWLIVRRLRRRV